MHKWLILFLLVLSSGCSVAYERQLAKEHEAVMVQKLFPDKHVDLHVLEFDGCEYVMRGDWFAHKGNCTNAIHMYNKVEK